MGCASEKCGRFDSDDDDDESYRTVSGYFCTDYLPRSERGVECCTVLCRLRYFIVVWGPVVDFGEKYRSIPPVVFR